MAIKSYTQKKGIINTYYEETIYDDRAFEKVKAVGRTPAEAREKAERAWRDRQLGKK